MASLPKNSGGQGNQFSHWLQKNIYIKIFLFFLIIMLMIGFLVVILSSEDKYNYIIKSFFMPFIYISYFFNKLPLYNYWSNNFSAFVYFYEFQYTILKKNFTNIKTYIFLIKFYLESLPFLFAYFLLFKRYKRIQEYFINYEKSLKWRNLRAPENPKKLLELSIYTEGTFELGKDEYDAESVEVLTKFLKGLNILKIFKTADQIKLKKEKIKSRILEYELSLYKMLEKLPTEKEWNDFFFSLIDNEKNPYEYLKVPMFKGNIDYANLSKKEIRRLKIAFSWKRHFKYLILEKKWVPREFYIDSLKKIITGNELYYQYEALFYFYYNKELTNFSLFSYTLNYPNLLPEFKKACKWVDSLNAPGKVNIIVSTKPRLKTIEVDLYFRLYMLKGYLGINDTFMLDYLKIIDKDYDI